MICFVEQSTVKLSPTSAFLSVVFVSFLSMRLLAQVSPGVQEIDGIRQNQRVTTYESAPNTAVIIVHIFAEEKPVSLDRSARVDLTNLGNHRGVFLIVPGRDDAVFVNTALGRYTISVTAVGYMSASQAIIVLSPEKQDVEIVLHRDPGAVTLNEASGLLSRKARKEASRAVSLLKSGDLTNAEKRLKTAYVSAPSNADLNFLLGYLYFQKNDYAQAGTYLGTAASLSPHSAQTLTLLGRTKLAVQNYPEAQSALEQAILVDSEEWLAHDLLANTYLHQKEFSKARRRSSGCRCEECEIWKECFQRCRTHPRTSIDWSRPEERRNSGASRIPKGVSPKKHDRASERSDHKGRGKRSTTGGRVRDYHVA